MRRTFAGLVVIALVAGCGDNRECSLEPFKAGDPDGHPEPLGASSMEARAGRIAAADLPHVPSELVTWKEGDFVIANNRIALVIEDVGDSDLYDPWGGRPVGLARVDNREMVEPNNFGELFMLTGRSTVVTDSVSVLADGRDGGPAIIRARGKLHPLPFFDNLIAAVYSETWTDIDATIDYVLAPGADHVDVYVGYASSRAEPKDSPSTLHALMYTERTPAFQPIKGFDPALANAPYVALVDDQATSWAYIPGEGVLGTPINASGFLGAFSAGFTMPACQRIFRLHAKIAIGGPGLDGAVVAAASALGEVVREVSGTVTRGKVSIPNVHIHATDGSGRYLTRGVTDSEGKFSLHVPLGADVTLTAYKRGDQVVTVHAGYQAKAPAIDLPAVGSIAVSAMEAGNPLPVRIQVLPVAPTTIPTVPDNFGETRVTSGRLDVVYAIEGRATVIVPPGRWEVVVSRGYEYEIERRIVDVVANAQVRVDAALDRSVATPSIQCGDFHIHTWRSNDSGDNAIEKVAQAIADGVEMPVRTEHEWVADFEREIGELFATQWAAAFASIEMTSFETWGHMGVFPLTPRPDEVNAGAPKWQTFPTADAPDTEFSTLSPKVVFDNVRERPEAPVIIINHPRGATNYFGYVGYDPATGTARNTADWDTKFSLVEVFNDAHWKQNRDSHVADWFGLLKAGRKVFAVGSSDSHAMSNSPVGYPRTCIQLGTDDPRQLTQNGVRDALAAGHSTVSGGIYVTARLGTAGPGDTVTGAGSPMMVDVTVQAATWIDVDAIDVVVDGETVDTIPVMPGDADPANPAIRWRGQVPVQVRAAGGFVVIAAYAQRTLEPVHPGRTPFGVTNPIFVTP
ncbi:MAG: CehA/McbA family metallohydrolase [Deltaproteobacteria bacterium]|nr:CehA/McbA family metallohydrolase [Deltaproteobacteria bacterium]